MELHFLSKSILFLLIGHMMERAYAASYMAHSHHNKRQQPAKTPQLTLNVEPHHGIEPHHSHPSVVRDFYFPLGASLFNFTCTIKHPSHRYRLLITRESKSPGNLSFFLFYLFIFLKKFNNCLKFKKMALFRRSISSTNRTIYSARTSKTVAFLLNTPNRSFSIPTRSSFDYHYS